MKSKLHVLPGMAINVNDTFYTVIKTGVITIDFGDTVELTSDTKGTQE